MKFDIDQLLANLIDARKAVKGSLDELDRRIEETRQFKRFAARPIEVTTYKSDSVVETNRFIPTQTGVQQFNTDYGELDCIAHCTSMIEALYAWADDHDDEVFLPDLVAPLRAANLTKAKKDHGLLSTLEGYCVRAHPEHWEKIGTRHYRRIRHELPEVPEPGEAEVQPVTADDDPRSNDEPQSVAAD